MVVIILLNGNIYNNTNQYELIDVNDIENKKNIAQGVLEDTKRQDLYNINDLERVELYFGNITDSDDKDVVVAVNFGAKNTIVAGYKRDGENYTYIGDVGSFYEVSDIEFISVPSEEQDVVVVNEFINQQLGAYETAEYLQGFFYDDGEFVQVLKSPTNIDAGWNDTWDNENGNENLWKKIHQESSNEWIIGEVEKNKNTNLELIRYQKYYTSEEGEKTVIPKDETFIKSDERIIKEKFTWSDKWGKFILGEGVEKSTGKKVAILEERDASPYYLAGYVENKLLVEFENGEEKLVNNKDINIEKLP